MNTERLRTLANRFESVGVGGLFTRAEQKELCALALEAAALLEQPAPAVSAPQVVDMLDDLRTTILAFDFDGKTEGSLIYRIDAIESALRQRPAGGQEVT